MDEPMVKNAESKILCHHVIMKKSSARKGLVYGVVFKPGSSEKRDLQKQWIEAEAIADTAREYMRDYFTTGEMHKKFNKDNGIKNPDYRVTQSFIAPCDFEIDGKKFEKDSWIMEWEILNPVIKQKVFKGIYRGFSPGGSSLIEADKTEEAA